PPGERLRAIRMACLIELLYASGLRVSELLSLPKSAAKTRQPLIAVRGKGGKERLVPISDPARVAVQRYREALEAQAPGLAKSACLFPLRLRGAHSPPPAFRPRSQSRRRGGRPVGRAHQPARATSRLRQPSLAAWRRSSRRTGPARARRYLDDADLYACARRARQG